MLLLPFWPLLVTLRTHAHTHRITLICTHSFSLTGSRIGSTKSSQQEAFSLSLWVWAQFVIVWMLRNRKSHSSLFKCMSCLPSNRTRSSSSSSSRSLPSFHYLLAAKICELSIHCGKVECCVGGGCSGAIFPCCLAKHNCKYIVVLGWGLQAMMTKRGTKKEGEREKEKGPRRTQLQCSSEGGNMKIKSDAALRFKLFSVTPVSTTAASTETVKRS